MLAVLCVIFFFKQKTAYEMRISDWSSDVCSSDLDRFSEGDPRALELNGAFNAANRGLIEFIEIFKNETEYLHTIITATQEKVVPAPGRHGTVYVDTAIIGHSNEAEWQKFKSEDRKSTRLTSSHYCASRMPASA